MKCPSCATDLAPQTTICGACGHLIEDPLIGTTLNDRFRIQEKLAVGGFGSIYRATQLNNNRKVAVKVMHRELSADEQLVARFRREAVTLCSLRDAHTVTTYEVDQTSDGRMFIVMELLEGKNMLELFRQTGPLPWRRMLGIARAVCSSLAEAHALGIVHRDLKPANIFLEPRRGSEDFVKVLDFGIAKIIRGSDIDDGSEELTVTGQAVGTLEYMAPEQLLGGKCDGRTDIYTLGVVAYEMIVGRRPFSSTGVIDLLQTMLNQKVPKPSLYVPLPSAVTDILLRCLERDEEARFQDVTQLAAAIDDVLRQSDMELLATKTSTTRGHVPSKVSTGPIKHLSPSSANESGATPILATPVPGAIPHTPMPGGGFEAPPARRLVGDGGPGSPGASPQDASYPAMPAPFSGPGGFPQPGGFPYPGGIPMSMASDHRSAYGPGPGPAPARISPLRIAILMLVLAAVGVGAGMLISELGI
ncbi:MAG TPA: protein kinase [Kofleriaceae bacterium]|nr:protein kinase [Kofleriaceae bacterium]